MLRQAAAHIHKLQQQLLASAYPLHIIWKHTNSIIRKHRGTSPSSHRPYHDPLRSNLTSSEKSLLRIPYIDPILSRLISNEVNRHNLPIWLVQHVFPTLQNRLVTYNRKSTYGSCQGCQLCVELRHNCATRFVIYELTCSICSATYIGKTYRPIKVRLREHNSSARLGNQRTAAGEHILQAHPEIAATGTDPFNRRRILRVTSNRLDLLNAELQEISRLKPTINTQHRR